jgi:hypothetical protein
MIKGQPEFEAERNNLIKLIQQFQLGGATTLTSNPHPFFGKMNTDEWNALMFKHLDHHLRQFGA